jgi:hypothetical protein
MKSVINCLLIGFSLMLTGCPIWDKDTGRDRTPDNPTQGQVDCRACGIENHRCCPLEACQMVYEYAIDGKRCVEGLVCRMNSEINRDLCVPKEP